MEKLPAALESAEPLMQCNIIEEFDIPKANHEMGRRLQEYLDRGGKYLRPAIVLSAMKACGKAGVESGVWLARSLQYDHNFFLIHDDMEDGSLFRRGRPTMHILYGNDFAINYGDYLRSIAEMAMDRGSNMVGPGVQRNLILARHEMLKTTAEGQDLEFALRSQPLSKTTESKVLAILESKSAFYTIWTPFRYGALASHVQPRKIDELKPALINIGLAFQIRDDVLDMLAAKTEETGEATLESQKFGKDWLGDLEEIKRTIPLCRTIERLESGDRIDRTYLYKMLDTGGIMRNLVSQRNEMRMEAVASIAYGDNCKDGGIEERIACVKSKLLDMMQNAEYRELQERIDHAKSSVLDIMNKYNALEDSQDTATGLYEDNIGTVEEALPDSEGRKELLELLQYAVMRKF